MSSLQFPPSSPVLDGPDSCPDPFMAKQVSRGRPSDYPTPNPSSTLGRSSSPTREEAEHETHGHFQKSVRFSDVSVEAQTPQNQPSVSGTLPSSSVAESPSRHHRKVSINKDFNIINPNSSVVRVPLLPTKTALTIGRSSKACDFHFSHLAGPLDKSVSRCHVRVDYSQDSLSFKCLGFNGFGMIIPRMCSVSKERCASYSVHESTQPLAAQNLSKTIYVDNSHTEFHVARGESVTMPRFNNVLLQIGRHVLLVNPEDCDEEVTDDESSVSAAVAGQNVADASNSKKSLVPNENARQESPMVVGNVHQKGSTPSLHTPTALPTVAPSTPHKTVYKDFGEEPTPSRSTKSSEDKENRLLATPKTNQETQITSPLTPLAVINSNKPAQKRRAQSEEPQGSLKKTKKDTEYDSNGLLVIDSQCLKGVPNVSEIENIIINHLAFSRLSSTPASFLNTISAAVAKLSLQQLRAVLHEVRCIGVIYRQGKDAAGKPLEEEYYYIPENDRDPERNKLVSSVKGHGGLRACRRTHKQYYWKKPAPIKK